MANATNWPTWGGNFLSTLPPDLLLVIWANHPEVRQNINQNLDITFLNSLILKHASPHAMTQATGSSFFTQAMALATANTSSTTLPELLAFVSARLGQQRANTLVQKVGHLLTLEQQYTLQETYLYGSSRLGVKNQNTTLSTRIASVQNGSLTPIGNAILNTDSVFSGTAAVYGLPKAPNARVFNRTWGLKQYELSNHLGNVQVTISDKKHGIVGANQEDFIAYEPEVKSATDYYPGGMIIESKSYSISSYKFGFTNQERDDELYGIGNFIQFEFRFVDTRLIRFFTIDPLIAKFPFWSPYQFGGNQLIGSRELEGCEPEVSFSAVASARINVGGKDGASGSIGIAAGFNLRSGNFGAGLNGAATFNLGGLGTSSLTGNSRTEFSASVLGTYGSGNAGTQGVQTINSQTPSVLENNFKYSFSVGLNSMGTSDNRPQMSAYIGGRRGDVSAGHTNDVPFGSDSYWGAETSIQFGNKGGLNATLWNEVYNGERICGKDGTPNRGLGYTRNTIWGKSYEVQLVQQNADNVSLNNARTSIIMSNTLANGDMMSVILGAEGGANMFLQRALHYAKGDPQFKHNIEQFFLFGGFSFSKK